MTLQISIQSQKCKTIAIIFQHDDEGLSQPTYGLTLLQTIAASHLQPPITAPITYCHI